MEKENKRLFLVILVLAAFLGMLVSALRHPVVSFTGKTDAGGQEKTAYDEAEPEVTLWYTDASLTDYFETCARQYYGKTGVAVDVILKDSLGFVETVYQTSMDDTGYPDIYMIQNDSLGKAWLYGLAAENEDADAFAAGYAANAVTASSCDGKMYAYPLTFRTTVFVYQTSAFAETPASIQSILDLAETSEIGIMAGNLIEWDVTDEFYGFPFVGSSLSFEIQDGGKLCVNCDEELYQKELTYYQGLADTVAIDTETITRQQVLDDFSSGATLSAIMDSEDLSRISGIDYQVGRLPAMNEELSMKGCSYTELLVVNDFSREQKKAADFAAYVTTECAKDLEPETGHISVKSDAVTAERSRVIYSQYEDSAPIPNTMDVEEFLRELKNKLTAVWNGADIS